MFRPFIFFFAMKRFPLVYVWINDWINSRLMSFYRVAFTKITMNVVILRMLPQFKHALPFLLFICNHVKINLVHLVLFMD